MAHASAVGRERTLAPLVEVIGPRPARFGVEVLDVDHCLIARLALHFARRYDGAIDMNRPDHPVGPPALPLQRRRRRAGAKAEQVRLS